MEYEKAAAYWAEKDRDAVPMDREALLARAEAFFAAHNTCALAAASGDFVRCTPIEYTYRDGRFWMLSEGGLKFRALAGNRNVCLAVFEPYRGFGALEGAQISGRAELVEPWSPDYRGFLAFKKIPEQTLRELDHPMYLIRVTPVSLDYLSSALAREGFAVRQHLDF